MQKIPLSVFLVIVSAVAIDGNIATAGTLVEVTDAEARNLLHRGKARLATAEDGVPEGDETVSPEGPAVDLSKLTKPQLLEHAAQLMIADAEKLTKAEILAAIEARQAAVVAAAAAGEAGSA